MSWMSNKSLFSIHRWIGLNCGVVLFVICLSGTAATLSEEIDWLINPALRVVPAGEPLAWDELQERVEAQYGTASVRAVIAPRNERTAAFVDVETATGRLATLLVDPYSGDVQGVASYHCVKVLFRVFHKQFYIFGFPKGVHGTYLVGTYGVVLLIAGLTGLLVYKRFWRRLFVLRWNAGRSVFWRDSHRLLGVWTAVLLFVWSLTGVWYLAEKVLFDVDLVTTSARIPFWDQRGEATGNLPASRPTASEMGMTDYLRITERELPGAKVAAIYLPKVAGGPTIVFAATGALLVREDSSQLLIDSLTGEILARQKAEDLGAFDRWTVTADPLHFGTFGGLPTKILWCLFGLGVSALIPIGATIWYRRTSKPVGRPDAKGLEATRTRRAKAASIGFNSLILTLAVAYTYSMSPPRLDGEAHSVVLADIGGVEIGPWTAELARLGSAAPGEDVTFRLRFPRSSLPNMKRATLALGSQETAFSGTWNFHHCRLTLPEGNDLQDDLILTIEGRDGAVHRRVVPYRAWSAEGDWVADSIPPANASPVVTGIFLSFFAAVGLFTGIWFWKIG